MDDPGAGGTRCRDPGCYSAGRAGKCRGAGKRPGPGRAERTPDSLVRHRRPSRSSVEPPGPGRPVRAAAPASARGGQASSSGGTIARRDPGRAGGRDRRDAGSGRPRPGYRPCAASHPGGSVPLLGAPAAPAQPAHAAPAQPAPAAERPGRPESGAAFSPAGLVHGVRLAPGVMLLLEGADREPGPDDVTEIVNAARPLVRELADRGLCACGPDDPPGVQGHPPGVEQPAEESRT